MAAKQTKPTQKAQKAASKLGGISGSGAKTIMQRKRDQEKMIRDIMNGNG